LGCAICAGRGAGWYDDIDGAATGLARFEKTLQPSRRNHALYEDLYSNWTEVYQRTLEMVEDGLLRPLWRAVGTS
jgi:autoinducer 2 (AI-2) kinase